MKNQKPLACAAGVIEPATARWGKKGKLMFELISAVGWPCRRRDGNKNVK